MHTGNFDSTKIHLEELLDDIYEGKLQLPDFQRDFVWDDERIKNLLSSVSLSYPIGAIMLLEMGGEGIRFAPRPILGTPEEIKAKKVEPEKIILDGQQRLTALYQALKNRSPVETKDTNTNSRIKRFYYIDIEKALKPDNSRDQVIISVPEDKKIKSFGGEISLDVSTPEFEFEQGLFPLNRVFDLSEWRQGYNKFWNYEKEKISLFDEFESKIIKSFTQYELPAIILKKGTPKEAVCLVFERVNTGGMALTVFDLVTASFAAEDYRLRDDWEKRKKNLEKHEVLKELQSDDFLQAVTLLVTKKAREEAVSTQGGSENIPGISCKRKDILNLKVEDWKEWAEKVENGFIDAARFLNGQKIFYFRDLPYRTQLVPLAAIFVSLGKDGEKEGIRQKIARWYWCGVFGELYGSAIETRFAHDLPEVVDWVKEGEEPLTVKEANFQPQRLETLRTRNSAAYKGIFALLMRDGCRDFRTGEPIDLQTFFDENIDIHHIFPEKWCNEKKLEKRVYNSIINKTPVSARTNRIIGEKSPSEYLAKLEKEAEIPPERMDEILRSHCIEPGFLRNDSFADFYEARREALLSKIENAMGKRITREEKKILEEPLLETVEEEIPDYEI